MARTTETPVAPTATDGPIGETIRVRDASKTRDISKPMLYQLMKNRQIAYVEIGRHRRIVVKSLDEWLRKRLVPAIVDETAG